MVLVEQAMAEVLDQVVVLDDLFQRGFLAGLGGDLAIGDGCQSLCPNLR